MTRSRPSEAMITATAGALSLAIAMGIGRFAFTPLLPMMLRDGVIDIHDGSVLATANYAGYLVGALVCMVLPAVFRRAGRPMPGSALLVRFALVMTGLLTLAMALPVAPVWPVLRGLSGVISAIGFVYTSGYCLARLTRMGQGRLAGIIFTGPGIGITLSGLGAFGLAGAGAAWTSGWLVFGSAALVLSVPVWLAIAPGQDKQAVTGGATMPDMPARGWSPVELLLTLAYGLAGFGYIITATFLPVIARDALPGSGLVDLFWPLFGIAVAAGALLTQGMPLHADRRLLLSGCYLMQSAGIGLTLFLPTVAGFVGGSILLGLPFTAITLFAMQEVRRLRPVEPTAFMGLMTASYGVGQIAGPVLVSAVLVHSPDASAGFSVSLMIATASLLAGAMMFLVLGAKPLLTDL